MIPFLLLKTVEPDGVLSFTFVFGKMDQYTIRHSVVKITFNGG